MQRRVGKAVICILALGLAAAPPVTVQSAEPAGGSVAMRDVKDSKITVNNYFGLSPEESKKFDERNETTFPSEADGYSFLLKGCVKIRLDMITCPFSVVNNGQDRELTLLADRRSFIINADGIQQFADIVQLGIGHGAVIKTYVAAGVPVKGAISVDGNGVRIDGVPRLRLYIASGNQNGVVSWNDVQILDR